MTNCIRTSSRYDGQFEHVTVFNGCSEGVRVTVESYVQNRSCTMGGTTYLDPGEAKVVRGLSQSQGTSSKLKPITTFHLPLVRGIRR